MHQFIYLLGTHPLVVSILAQCFVLYEAARAGEKGSLWQSVLLIVALVIVVASIQLRPPAKPNALADGVGTVAAVFFTLPAAIAFQKTRAQRPDKKDDGGEAAK
jgi:hypothetical protein